MELQIRSRARWGAQAGWLDGSGEGGARWQVAPAGPAHVSAHGDPTRGPEPAWESGGRLPSRPDQGHVAQKRLRSPGSERQMDSGPPPPGRGGKAACLQPCLRESALCLALGAACPAVLSPPLRRPPRVSQHRVPPAGPGGAPWELSAQLPSGFGAGQGFRWDFTAVPVILRGKGRVMVSLPPVLIPETNFAVSRTLESRFRAPGLATGISRRTGEMLASAAGSPLPLPRGRLRAAPGEAEAPRGA